MRVCDLSHRFSNRKLFLPHTIRHLRHRRYPGRQGLVGDAVNWRKATSWRTEICGLPLIGTRGSPLHLAVVRVIAQIKFELRRLPGSAGHPLTRRNDGLRDIVAGQDLFPDPFGELVATVGGAAAIAGICFKE